MPLYVYHCQDCNHDFEIFLSFADSQKIPECPYCKGLKTKKQLASFSTSGLSGSSNTGGSTSGCGGSGRFT